MAARFDASRAAALGQQSGDGTPIMVTMPTDRPWVPLRILGLGAQPRDVIEADVFLLTDARPKLLAGGRGLTVGRSEEASDLLLTDLRTDVGMEWVPEAMWFTHLPLEAAAGDLDYDLAVSATDADLPRLADAGIEEPEAVVPSPLPDGGLAIWPLVVGLAAAGLVFGTMVGRRRRTEPSGPAA
jgi:hypothetical protein